MKPTAIHKFVRGDGSKTEYIEATTRDCVVCNPQGAHEDRRMAVVSILDNAVNLECLNCGADEVMLLDEYEHFYRRHNT